MQIPTAAAATTIWYVRTVVSQSCSKVSGHMVSHKVRLSCGHRQQKMSINITDLLIIHGTRTNDRIHCNQATMQCLSTSVGLCATYHHAIKHNSTCACNVHINMCTSTCAHQHVHINMCLQCHANAQGKVKCTSLHQHIVKALGDNIQRKSHCHLGLKRGCVCSLIH